MKRFPRSSFQVCLGLSLFLLLFSTIGCSEQAEQLFEIAEMEEQRNNDGEARKLYERIMTIDPEGYFATKAKERLAELDQKTVGPTQERN